MPHMLHVAQRCTTRLAQHWFDQNTCTPVFTDMIQDGCGSNGGKRGCSVVLVTDDDNVFVFFC